MRLLRISEAAAMLGVSPSALRLWDSVGWLRPVFRTPGGERRYSVDAIEEFKVEREKKAASNV
jgi:DNA-binding transcriptional MerR regulator